MFKRLKKFFGISKKEEYSHDLKITKFVPIEVEQKQDGSFLLNNKNEHETKRIEKARHIYKQTKNKRIKNKQIKKILGSEELYNAFKL